MEKSYLIVGSVFVLFSIVLGAFGSHALRPLLPDTSFYGYTVATQYLAFQGLSLLVLGALTGTYQISSAVFYCLSAGTLLFSGSILLLTVGKLWNWKLAFLGPVTPLGGLVLIVGWIWLIQGFIRL